MEIVLSVRDIEVTIKTPSRGIEWVVADQCACDISFNSVRRGLLGLSNVINAAGYGKPLAEKVKSNFASVILLRSHN